jgi:L-asparaginase
VQNQPSGVYIAMNGKVFDIEKVQKNISLGIFEDT